MFQDSPYERGPVSSPWLMESIPEKKKVEGDGVGRRKQDEAEGVAELWHSVTASADPVRSSEARITSQSSLIWGWIWPEIKLPTSSGSSKKQESSRKTSTSALLTTPKTLTMWITTKCGKFFKRWEYQTTWPASWEICIQVKKQQLESDMEQTGSKSGKEYIKAVYCHPAYLTYMQSTSWEVLGWMKHKLESRLPVEISKTSDIEMTPPFWRKAKKN